MHVPLVQKMWFPELLGLRSSTWEVIWGKQAMERGWGCQRRVCAHWDGSDPKARSPGPCFLFHTLISLQL